MPLNEQKVIHLHVIAVCYYLSIKEFEQSVERFISNLNYENTYVTKNFLSIRENQKCNVSPWIPSLGDLLDMSAYSTGAMVVSDADCYLLLNDTLFSRNPWRMISRRFADLIFALNAATKASAVGLIHKSTDILMLDYQNPSRHHLSTFCFMLNRQAFQIFKEITQTLPCASSIDTISIWVNENIKGNDALNNLLYVHLSGSKTLWTWAGLKKNSSNDLVLKKQATVIIEYLLTSKILQSGGFIMPVNIGLIYKLRAKICIIIARFYP